MERRCYAEDDRALYLCADCVGIDDGAAIDRADDAPDTSRTLLRYFDFGYMRHIAREDKLESEPAPSSLGQRLSPVGFFGDKV
jgi:hypothetical protein